MDGLGRGRATTLSSHVAHRQRTTSASSSIVWLTLLFWHASSPADKNCEKIHYISPQIRCCGAGTAADTEFTTALISSNVELHSLSTGRKPRVVTAMTMLKQMLYRYAHTPTHTDLDS